MKKWIKIILAASLSLLGIIVETGAKVDKDYEDKLQPEIPTQSGFSYDFENGLNAQVVMISGINNTGTARLSVINITINS